MTDPATFAITVLSWLHLLTCADAPTDAGGVRCASFAAAVVSPPWVDGEAQGGTFLAAVARAESQSSPVGVHARDTWAARTMYRRAARAGWLTPSTCPGHRASATGGAGEWGVRGAWGVSAAYGLRWLGPVGCLLGPAVLDVPALGAVAAAGHARHCARVRRTRDSDELRMCWAGRAKPRGEVLKRWRR